MLLRKISRWFGKHPLLSATLVVVAGAGVGFGVAYGQTGKLQENLQSAAIALVFVGFVGGITKLLLDDFQRSREKRSEQAQFLTTVLADLKAVYDRVERARILIPAHQSALTYGREMRDLIEARVQLRNVVRALDRGTSGIAPDPLNNIRRAVQLMERYLGSLTDEFQLKYKPIADKQNVYEARVKNALAQPHPQPLKEPQGDRNEAWVDITKLPKMKGFIGERLLDAAKPEATDKLEYARRFEGPLDLVSWVLRNELRILLGEEGETLPPDHTATQNQLSLQLAELKQER
jgi:hypothetical protein